MADGRIGKLLAGKYRIEAVIAAGGMGTVYRARHRNQGQFAVKVLNSDLALYPDMRARFLREGYAANSVQHPGVVSVVDDDVDEDGSVFMVMELLRGADVERLGRARRGMFDLPLAMAIVDELLSVLAAAHAKDIVHRDVKPANLFVTTAGALKVLDFGIARARAAAAELGIANETRTGVLLGTPAFMAPEQARGAAREIDAKTDLWAVGATLFTMLTGQTVHEAESAAGMVLHASISPARSLSAVAARGGLDVPGEIARVVDRALAFEKAARWESAAAMRAALRDACADAKVARIAAPALAAIAIEHAERAHDDDDDQGAVSSRVLSTLESARTEHADVTPQGASPRRAPIYRKNKAIRNLAIGLVAFGAVTLGVSLRHLASRPGEERDHAQPPALPVAAAIIPRHEEPPPAQPMGAAPKDADAPMTDGGGRPSSPTAGRSARTDGDAAADASRRETRRAIDEQDPYGPAPSAATR